MERFRRQFPLCLVVCTIVTLWTFTAGSHAIAARDAARSRIAAQHSTLARLTKQLEKLQAERQAANDLLQRCDSIRGELRPATDADLLMKQVRQIAEINSLNVESLKIISANATAGVTTRTVRLKLLGGFNGFYSALLQLETASPSIAVTDLRLQRLADGDAEMSGDVTMLLLLRSTATTTGATP